MTAARRIVATVAVLWAAAVVLEVVRGLAVDQGWADDGWDETRRHHLDELTRISQELGLYGDWWDDHG
jgi:hypothetical protein